MRQLFGFFCFIMWIAWFGFCWLSFLACVSGHLARRAAPWFLLIYWRSAVVCFKLIYSRFTGFTCAKGIAQIQIINCTDFDHTMYNDEFIRPRRMDHMASEQKNVSPAHWTSLQLNGHAQRLCVCVFTDRPCRPGHFVHKAAGAKLLCSDYYIFVPNSDIFCVKIWRGRGGEDNPDEI